MKRNINVVFRPEPEGGFTVFVPMLPGCITYGEDLTSARDMAREAIELYLESMVEDGEEIPDAFDAYASSLEITLPDDAKKETVPA